MNIDEYDENGIRVEWVHGDHQDLNESHERDFWTEDEQETNEDFFL